MHIANHGGHVDRNLIFEGLSPCWFHFKNQSSWRSVFYGDWACGVSYALMAINLFHHFWTSATYEIQPISLSNFPLRKFQRIERMLVLKCDFMNLIFLCMIREKLLWCNSQLCTKRKCRDRKKPRRLIHCSARMPKSLKLFVWHSSEQLMSKRRNAIWMMITIMVVMIAIAMTMIVMTRLSFWNILKYSFDVS